MGHKSQPFHVVYQQGANIASVFHSRCLESYLYFVDILGNNPVCYSNGGMSNEMHQKGPQMYPFEGDKEYTIKYIL